MTTAYNYRSKELSSELEQSQKDAGCLRAKGPIIARAQAGPGGCGMRPEVAGPGWVPRGWVERWGFRTAAATDKPWDCR